MIYAVAESHGLCTDDFGPICDGIADEEGYLHARLRVAWILKEPYDAFSPEGKPCGGYWSLVKDCFSKDDAWRHPVWQKIAYVMYGFKNNLHWCDLPWIRDCRQIIEEIKSVAWINLSKMPAHQSSVMPIVASNYRQHWKPVVEEQLRLYEPNVVIFGNTFNCMKDTFPHAEMIEKYSNKWVYFWRSGKQILLDTYHPGRKGEGYVNALIDALQIACRELRGGSAD